MKKILVILGHPDLKSLNKKIADSYVDGAKKNFEVKKLYLAEMKFDPILHYGYSKEQKLEPDLKKAQKYIKWADHIVLVYPIWWTSFPALLKGFIDRTLLPEFAFKYDNKGKLQKFLTGKTASLIMTTGGPKLWYFLFGKIMNKPMSIGILKFCGINPKKQIFICDIKKMPEQRVKDIFDKIKKMGEKGI